MRQFLGSAFLIFCVERGTSSARFILGRCAMKWTQAAPAKRTKAKKTVLKKPAATSSSSARAAPAPSSIEETDAVFRLDDFIEKLWEAGGYRPAKAPSRNVIACGSACTGSGAYEYVLKHMLQKTAARAKMRFGAEWDPAPVQFMMRNKRNPQCVFQDHMGITSDSHGTDNVWLFFA